MARAFRHYIPGLIWHVTQRCHNQNFLFRFPFYRSRWLYWMDQANQRFQISVLNYAITSNHIQLLVMSNAEENHIARTMHLVSGRTAWEFNHRKNRNGSFWGDRYHATAVESDTHLHRCMIYIDMNMVRAGVVKHPRDWQDCGYHELIGDNKKYILIDRTRLLDLLQTEERSFREMYDTNIVEHLDKKNFQREKHWTEGIAVGSQDFVMGVKNKLGYKAKGRRVLKESDFYQLREPRASYLRFRSTKKVV